MIREALQKLTLPIIFLMTDIPTAKFMSPALKEPADIRFNIGANVMSFFQSPYNKKDQMRFGPFKAI